MKMLILLPGSFQMRPRSQEQVSIRKESEEGSPPARVVRACRSLFLFWNGETGSSLQCLVTVSLTPSVAVPVGETDQESHKPAEKEEEEEEEEESEVGWVPSRRATRARRRSGRRQSVRPSARPRPRPRPLGLITSSISSLYFSS